MIGNVTVVIRHFWDISIVENIRLAALRHWDICEKNFGWCAWRMCIFARLLRDICEKIRLDGALGRNVCRLLRDIYGRGNVGEWRHLRTSGHWILNGVLCYNRFSAFHVDWW